MTCNSSLLDELQILVAACGYVVEEYIWGNSGREGNSYEFIPELSYSAEPKSGTFGQGENVWRNSTCVRQNTADVACMSSFTSGCCFASFIWHMICPCFMRGSDHVLQDSVENLSDRAQNGFSFSCELLQ
nr:hypothetical protein CFP56_69668 [Quercus suber]